MDSTKEEAHLAHTKGKSHSGKRAIDGQETGRHRMQATHLDHLGLRMEMETKVCLRRVQLNKSP